MPEGSPFVSKHVRSPRSIDGGWPVSTGEGKADVGCLVRQNRKFVAAAVRPGVAAIRRTFTTIIDQASFFEAGLFAAGFFSAMPFFLVTPFILVTVAFLATIFFFAASPIATGSFPAGLFAVGSSSSVLPPWKQGGPTKLCDVLCGLFGGKGSSSLSTVSYGPP